MKKVFVLDTSVILHDPYCLYKFDDNIVVIPAIVLEELDSKKKQQDEVGKNAREFTRIVDSLKDQYPNQLSHGVPLETGATLKIELNHVSFTRLEKHFIDRNNDNRILAVALNLHLEFQENQEEKKVVFVTNDLLPGIKGDTLGFETQKYESDRLVKSLDRVHKGHHEILIPSELIRDFYQDKRLDYEKIEEYIEEDMDVCPQDFFILKPNDGGKGSSLARLVLKENRLQLMHLVKYKDDPIFRIMPRNVQQKMALELLLDKEVELVCISGQAGTGKTLLALAAALQQTEIASDYRKILVARPIIPMGRDIGFLPGDMSEKLRPWMQPIYDNLEYLFDTYQEDAGDDDGQAIEKIVEGLKMDIEALTYIRGRSIPNQFIIIDECQNLSKSEILTIISRAGEGTKIVLIGDPEQIDHPYLDSTNNALTYVTERMKGEPDVGILRFEKTERSSLAEKAARLLK